MASPTVYDPLTAIDPDQYLESGDPPTFTAGDDS